jgi:hypothetical protein
VHQFTGPARPQIGAGQRPEESRPPDQEQLAAVLPTVVRLRPIGQRASYFAVTPKAEILYCTRSELPAPMPFRNARRGDCALIVEVST